MTSGTSLDLGEQQLHHVGEVARIAWENRDSLGDAGRARTEGVCDGGVPDCGATVRPVPALK